MSSFSEQQASVFAEIASQQESYAASQASSAPEGSDQWWGQQIAGREAAARRNTEENPVTPGSDYYDTFIQTPQTIAARQPESTSDMINRLTEERYRTRSRYVDERQLGDSETRRMTAGGLSAAAALELQRQKAQEERNYRAARFYANERDLANAQHIEKSSAVHHVGMDLGVPTGPNPYEYAGDKALILEKGMPVVDKGQLGRISPEYQRFGSSLPHPEGMQGASWDLARGIGNGRQDFSRQILEIDVAARNQLLGPYANAGRSTSYNVPKGGSYEWSVGEQQEIARGKTLDPRDPFRIYVGEGPGNTYYDTTRREMKGAGWTYGGAGWVAPAAKPVVTGDTNLLAGGSYYKDFYGPGKNLVITKSAVSAFRRMSNEKGELLLGAVPQTDAYNVQTRQSVPTGGMFAAIASGSEKIWVESNKKTSDFFKDVRAKDTVGQWGLGADETAYQKIVGKPSSQTPLFEGIFVSAGERFRREPLQLPADIGTFYLFGAAYEGLGVAGAALGRVPTVAKIISKSPTIAKAGSFIYRTGIPAAALGIYGSSVGVRAIEPDEEGNLTEGQFGRNLGNLTPELIGTGIGAMTYAPVSASVKRGAGYAGSKMVEGGGKLFEAVDTGVYKYQQRSMGIENIGVRGGARLTAEPITGRVAGRTYNPRQLGGFAEYRQVYGPKDMLGMSSRDFSINEWGMYGKPYQKPITFKGINAGGVASFGPGNELGAPRTYSPATLKAMNKALGVDWRQNPYAGRSMMTFQETGRIPTGEGLTVVGYKEIPVSYGSKPDLLWAKKFAAKGFVAEIQRPGRAIYDINKGIGIQYPGKVEAVEYGGGMRGGLFSTKGYGMKRAPSRMYDLNEGIGINLKPIRQVTVRPTPKARPLSALDFDLDDLISMSAGKKVSGGKRIYAGDFAQDIAPVLRGRDVTESPGERGFWFDINKKQKPMRIKSDMFGTGVAPIQDVISGSASRQRGKSRQGGRDIFEEWGRGSDRMLTPLLGNPPAQKRTPFQTPTTIRTPTITNPPRTPQTPRPRPPFEPTIRQPPYNPPKTPPGFPFGDIGGGGGQKGGKGKSLFKYFEISPAPDWLKGDLLGFGDEKPRRKHKRRRK